MAESTRSPLPPQGGGIEREALDQAAAAAEVVEAPQGAVWPARWSFEGPIPEQAYLQLIGDRRFASAARALACNMLTAIEGDRALDAICKDAGRYLAAMWALHLHLSGGLTLPRLKAASEASGFLSGGRSRDMLHYLQHLDYIAPTQPAAGGAALYAPTPMLMTAWQRHLKAALEAASLVETAAHAVLARFDEPQVFAAFAHAHAESLFLAARTADQQAAYNRVFLHRHAGNQVVWTLLAAGEDRDFPSREPLSVSFSATARRFGVSRTHVKRMFDDAAREGVLRTDRDGGFVFTDQARNYVQFLYAAQVVHLLAAAARTFQRQSARG